MNRIKQRANEVPLKTKLYVFFLFEWADFNIKGRGRNKEDDELSRIYAQEKTEEILKIINENT